MKKLFKWPKLNVVVVLLITAFFGYQLKNVALDNNNYRFVPETDQSRVIADYIEETFGSQVFVLIALDRHYDSVFEADFLQKIKEFDDKAELITDVESVDSVLSTDYITSEGDSIVVQPIVSEDFDGSAKEVNEAKHRVVSWEMYKNALVSDDLTSTQIIVKFGIKQNEAGNPESLEALESVHQLAKDIFEPNTTVYITGMPVFNSDINKAMSADIKLLIPIVAIVVIFVLFLSFKRGFAVVIPLITVLIATIWSMGAMPLFHVKLSVISTVLPVILIAVGSAYGIHVVTHYIDDRELKSKLTRKEHDELVLELVSKIGKPVSLAALTTFTGFVSFCFTNVLPIREFGIFSSFGVIASFIVAMTFIPSLFLIIGPRPLKKKLFSKSKNNDEEDESTKAIAKVFIAITRKKHTVLFLAVVIVVVSLFGVSKLIIDNVLVEYFKDGTDVVLADKFVREKFGGSKVVSVIIKSEKAGGVLDPEVLESVDSLEQYLDEKIPEVGKVTSFTDLVKRMNQVYNADESPDGLKPVEAPTVQDDFGFGSFDSFGFESSDDFSATTTTEPEVVATDNTDTITLDPLDVKTLVETLNDASLNRGHYTMNAEELLTLLREKVNYEGATYYEIPTDPQKYGKKTTEELKSIVSNYMLLLSGDISSYSNDPLEPTSIRMNVLMKTKGQIDTQRVVDAINAYVDAEFPETVSVEVGGMALVEAALSRLVVYSQLTSVIIALISVFIIIWVSYRSVIAGLIGVIPLSISILMNFAIMGFFGIKLNIGTALVASISIGIGIDYIIHYLDSYYRERKAANGKDFLAKTFTSSGKAIIINAVSVGAGFAVLILSKFNILSQLGILIAFTMFSSSLIALSLLPVILNWFKPSFLDKEF
ncbi:efflux RND transporter permease subunit [Spirochaeta cellobiosiphila]|uniref:efflux RND transporter permease subunit n=1 Tax=Spirochaeta cellobiosiphila TaxID=504483 RepID=UPI00040ED746|nr:MMPL family transporter [Spirochaeta cellobiosiphila]